MRRIVQRGAHPAVLRLYDAIEGDRNFKTGDANVLLALDERSRHLEDAVANLAEQRLMPGDKIVIYSDGVTEAQNIQGQFFGKKRLRAAVEGHAAANCAAIHDAIQEAVSAFTEGATQSDDITALVLEFRGAA
jgi:serine/threonine protein phosphatase PrpC